jgi:hypothetical protein
MATTTPNFGWAVPTSTDLVKDGALAIETLGDSIDASLVDLKGGTTGQVLSKNSNTNMDFTWVTSDDANAIQNTIVDAKGDLISATGSDVPARLAVGANGETLVADSSTSTGLRWQGAMAAGKNLLINGGFDIWQRGTSFASSGYMTDRWTDSGAVSNMTASQQTSGAPNGSRYILRYTATAGSAYKDLYQYIETAQAQQAWGNTLTFSIKMRRNATATGGNLGWSIQKSSTVDAGSGASWTSLGNSNTVLSSLTTGTGSTDWTTVTISAAIPNDGTANSLRVTTGFGAAQASGAIIEFAQAQLEIGSVATTFTRAGGTIQGELAACQRYYFRMNSNAVSSFAPFAQGGAGSTTSSEQFITYPVTMRTNPSSTVDFANLSLIDAAGGSAAVTALTLGQNTLQSGLLTATVASGLTQHRYYRLLANNSSSAFVGLTAEL